VVTFYVKNDAIASQDARTWVFRLNVIWAFPFRFARLSMPGFQLLFTIGMYCPKIPQYFFSYDAQRFFCKDK
jgi:hypothetical protein